MYLADMSVTMVWNRMIVLYFNRSCSKSGKSRSVHYSLKNLRKCKKNAPCCTFIDKDLHPHQNFTTKFRLKWFLRNITDKQSNKRTQVWGWYYLMTWWTQGKLSRLLADNSPCVRNLLLNNTMMSEFCESVSV